MHVFINYKINDTQKIEIYLNKFAIKIKLF